MLKYEKKQSFGNFKKPKKRGLHKFKAKSLAWIHRDHIEQKKLTWANDIVLPLVCVGICSLQYLSAMFAFCAIFDQLLWSIYDLLIISFSLLSHGSILKSDFSPVLLPMEFILLRWLHSQGLFVPIFSFWTLSFQLIYFFVNGVEGANHVSFLVFSIHTTHTV